MSGPRKVSDTVAKRAIPILLTVFVLSLVIDNAFKYVNQPIADSLNISLNTAGLQATIPGILIGIGAVVYSALSDAVSIRKLMIISIILVAIGSVIGFAFQGSWPIVLAARIIQTTGLAAAETLYVVFVTKHFTGDRQKTYLGFSTAAFQLSLLLGVVGGGFVATYISWPVLFLIALAPLLALPVVMKTVPEEETTSSSMDVFGLFLVAIVAGGFIMFLQNFMWAYLVAAVAAVALFAWHISHHENALITPAFFANKQYTLVLVVVLILYSVQLGYTVTFPVLMRELHGYAEAQSSLMLIPGYICAILVGILSGNIAKVLKTHTAIMIAMLMITGALLLPAFVVDAGNWVYILSMTMFPAGFALMYAPLVSTAVRRIPAENSGIAIGFYNLTINMAIPIGIAYSLRLLSQNLQFMGGFASPEGTPFASVLLILGVIAAAAFLLYLAVSKILHSDDPATTSPTSIH